jgi:hypothetical protein
MAQIFTMTLATDKPQALCDMDLSLAAIAENDSKKLNIVRT